MPPDRVRVSPLAHSDANIEVMITNHFSKISQRASELCFTEEKERRWIKKRNESSR